MRRMIYIMELLEPTTTVTIPQSICFVKDVGVVAEKEAALKSSEKIFLSRQKSLYPPKKWKYLAYFDAFDIKEAFYSSTPHCTRRS